MNRELHALLLRQFEISSALTCYHLESLTTEECLWRPGPVGLHIQTIAAWANLELMKSAAEIGYVRFLYAAG
jgi:hypothetical protein